jgi:outer membrane lipoprotein-sorting protein
MRAITLMLATYAVAWGAAAATETSAGSGHLAKTAQEVIARNVAARGGLEAWSKIDTMAWFGYIEHGNVSKDSPQAPFVLQMKRPNLTRFEVKEQTTEFTRIFDGQHGWRIRPDNQGRPTAKSFSTEEVKFAQSEYVIDGPLLDYQAKDITAALDGVDTVEGRKAYRLSLKLPSGAERKVWIDVKTNLEVRLDRPSTNPFAPGKPVSVYYRDYQKEGDVKLPHVIETIATPGGSPVETSDRLVIKHVLVNPTLEATAFVPPPTPLRHGGGSLVRIPGNMPGQQVPLR